MIAGNAISPSSLYAGYCIFSLILLLFSGATGTIFWIIGIFFIFFNLKQDFF
jgi:predicted metal-binding membrane protein